jgi:serine/threonine protein kinase
LPSGLDITMQDSIVGRTIGKYKIVEHLGRGGMAEVYKAHQEALDRYVAIKLMHSFLSDDQDFLSRFKREARNMAALNHPNIVSVYDFDVEKQTYYIVMEYVSGGTLKEKLEKLANRGEKLPLAEAVRTVLEIADALAYAHSRSMIHRDIKPANIMIDEDGKAVLTDFGIAKMLTGPSYTATGAMIGTPAYMSPEQGLGQPGDERSDIYSLGVLFFQMATGRLPFDADTPLAVVLKHVNDPVPLPVSFNPNIPTAIQSVILSGMAKEPAERFQSAHEFARALREAVRENDLSLATALPSELLQDKPTPTPLATKAGMTHARSAEATRLAARGSATVVSNITETEVAAPPVAAKTGESRRSPRSAAAWLAIGGAILFLLAAVVGGGYAVMRNGSATPATAVVVVDSPATPTLEPGTSTATATEPPTVDIGAQVFIALTAAAAANPTDTPTPTPSHTPTPTLTPDATGTFLATCVQSAELVAAHTYTSRQSQSAPVRSNFPLNWILKNNGTCPWPADLRWTFQSGEGFGQAGPVASKSELAPGEETTFQANLVAPATPGNYETIWQLVDAAGDSFGPEIKVTILIYIPATATATRPPATSTPAQTATPPTTADVSAHIELDASSCEYAGDQWRCTLIIVPSGGSGGPYVVWVQDSSPPAHYPNVTGRVTHLISWRRCFTWTNTIIVRDDPTGKQATFGRGYDPNTLFPGGCTLP